MPPYNSEDVMTDLTRRIEFIESEISDGKEGYKAAHIFYSRLKDYIKRLSHQGSIGPPQSELMARIKQLTAENKRLKDNSIVATKAELMSRIEWITAENKRLRN